MTIPADRARARSIRLLFGLPLLFVACGKKDSPAPAASAEPAPIGVIQSTVPDDPSKDGWDTEAAHEKIVGQLALLKKWLGHEGFPTEELGKIAHAQCRGNAPGPASVTGQFQDGNFSVRKGDPSQAGAAIEDLAGLRDAFAGLRVGELEQVALKVISISPLPQGWSTKLKMTLAEKLTEGRRQLNATATAEWTSDNPPLLTNFTVPVWEEVRVDAPALFADCTESMLKANACWLGHLALSADHWTARIESALGMDVNGQCGITLGDINGDGLDDIYLPQQGGLPNRLLLHQPDGTLKDVTDESGTGWLDDSHAALFVDLDNDGDQDLVLTTKDGVLFQANDGSGKFSVKVAKLSPTGAPYGLAAADYDQDGDIDLFTACYYQRSSPIKHYTLARPLPYHDATNGAQDMLLRNDGNWQFTQAAISSGITENKFGYAPAWQDYDQDGDLDLYVANDFGANHLWRNSRTPEGTVIFEEVAASAGVQDIGAGMSAAWGDPDNNGWMDLYVGNMFSSAGNRIAFQEKFQASTTAAERQMFQRHARGNSLFSNNGNGTFADLGEAAGVTMGRWAWSSRFGDINNDGWEDIHVANGYITQEDPHDL